jgi:hypothetical protein
MSYNSPFLVGQRGILQDVFLPTLLELPEDGLEPFEMTFDFGFLSGQYLLDPYGQQIQTIAYDHNALIWGMTVVSNPTPGGVAVVPPLLFQLIHNHDGVQRQFFNKSMVGHEHGGSGKHPLIVKSPQLVLKGDSVTCIVNNLGNNNLRAQVTLLQGQF